MPGTSIAAGSTTRWPMRGVVTGLVLAGVSLSTVAYAQTPVAPPADPAQAAAKAAFEALPDAARRAIQDDLIWTGDFNGVAGGEFGRRTYDAMLAFERRERLAADAVLTPPERAALKAAADKARAAVRFSALTDAATGIRIGLPQAVLTQRLAVQNGVVHRRADGQMSLQLSAFPAGEGLAALFERLRADGPGRKVTYRLQRPDWFVVSGEEGGRRFYTRVAEGPQGLRGYTFRFPLTEAATGDRLMVAIANSFEPFPGTEIAANPARSATNPATSTPAATPPTAPPLPAIAPSYAISGVRIGPTTLATSAEALKGCVEPTLAGRPLEAGRVRQMGAVALVEGAPSGPFVAVAEAGAAGQPLFTLSFDEAAPRGPALAPASLAGEAVMSAVQGGAGGAPVIDAAGRLVALVADAPRRVRMVAGVAPVQSHAVVRAGALPTAPIAGAATTPALAAKALVAIACARRG
jgi:peptidoglycan hydrolase-like protein with peptidoglycan-binding domain